MSKRRYKRYTKRLEVEFSASGMSFKGISSDISEKGLFIRTQHGFVPGTNILIKLHLPDGSVSIIKGIVRRTIKTRHSFVKNGMGVEIIEHDLHFENFLRQELIEYEKKENKKINYSTDSPEKTLKGDEKQTESDTGSTGVGFTTIRCPSCSVKNRVPVAYLSKKLKCGKCGASLI